MSQNQKEIKIEKSWKELLSKEFNKPYFLKIKKIVRLEYKTKIIYPHPKNIFNAFNLTPIDRVKVVIVGQDPYHGPNQAHGLCFSVLRGVKPPPSLINIFKELKNDIGIDAPNHGNLQSWASQGVLLINSTLTVQKGNANSHKNIGWETFTDKAIEKIADKKEGLVFLLWGAHAQKKKSLIDKSKHLILKAPHPSPLSAYNGFFGCKHFSRANEYLKNKGIAPIKWSFDK